MDSMKFIHAADLHIDSPLHQLEMYEGAPIMELRTATRSAFERVVNLALEKEVQFVVLAGDLFDGQWRDMRTGLWTAKQFRRLEKEGIRVYFLRGNHDAASRVTQTIRWPENVKEFPVDRPQTFIDEETGVALHGQGFSQPHISEDLAANYPPAIPGKFNIGVLHANLNANPAHDNYAATSTEVLISKDYDYWALGHVHTRDNKPLSTKPYIAYSGNTQGRRINEIGPKGCLMVEVNSGDEVSVIFHPTDVVRWAKVQIDLEESADEASMLQQLEGKLTAAVDAAEDRLVAVEVDICGESDLYTESSRPQRREQLIAEIHNVANSVGGVWIKRIHWRLQPPMDLAALRDGSDLFAELLQSIEAVVQDEVALQDVAAELNGLHKIAAAQLEATELELTDPERLRGWIQEAESLLLSRLGDESGGESS
jgi:exonuclease SbcD